MHLTARRVAFAVAAGAFLAAAASPACAQQMRDVTFIVVNNLFSTPAYVAAENGYWAKQGLNVTVKLTGSGRAVVQAVQAGDAQFGHAALEHHHGVGARQRQHAQGRDRLLQRRRLPREGGRPRHHRPQGPRHRRRQSEIDGGQEDRPPDWLDQRGVSARVVQEAQARHLEIAARQRAGREHADHDLAGPGGRGGAVGALHLAGGERAWAPTRSSSAAARKASSPT